MGIKQAKQPVLVCAARDCKRKFRKQRENHSYCSASCKNREKQRRWREKAQKAIAAQEAVA